MELCSGRGEGVLDDVEGVGSGDGDPPEAEPAEGSVEVAEGGEEGGGEVGIGGGEHLAAEGDGGDAGAGVKGGDVVGDPPAGDGVVGCEGREEGVGEGEEEGDAGVGEGADGVGAGVGEADSGEAGESLEQVGDGAVEPRRSGATKDGDADGGVAGDEDGEEEEGGEDEEERVGVGRGCHGSWREEMAAK